MHERDVLPDPDREWAAGVKAVSDPGRQEPARDAQVHLPEQAGELPEGAPADALKRKAL